jgi:mRNA interferase RelE/StbE
MIKRVSATPTFEKAVKKLHPKDKKTVDIAIRAVAGQPTMGQAKKGDLAGVHVYKFKINKQEVLMSYEILGSVDAELVLLALGSHENFYQKLKR